MIISNDIVKTREIFTGSVYKLFLSFTIITEIYRPLIRNKTVSTKYCLTQWIFKTPSELWNLLNKSVPDRLDGCGGHSKRMCLQDRDHFHKCRAWQIVLIFNTEMGLYIVYEQGNGFRWLKERTRYWNWMSTFLVSTDTNAQHVSGILLGPLSPSHSYLSICVDYIE